MTKALIRSLTLLAVCCIASTVQSQGVVVEFQGTANTTTREFEVQGPWLLNWRITGNYRSVGFELMLLDGKTRMHKGVILRTRRTGNGVKLFQESGSFRFRISSYSGH